MAGRKKRIDTHPDQLSLFAILSSLKEETMPAKEQGSLNVQALLREALIDCIKDSPLSRWEIAGAMSNLVDAEISIHMVNAWTAESKEGHRFPAEYLPAFCRAVGSNLPLKVLTEKCGVFMLPGKDALRSEIQKIDEDIKRLHKQKAKRRMLLKELKDGK